jgi:hypothetical protein
VGHFYLDKVDFRLHRGLFAVMNDSGIEKYSSAEWDQLRSRFFFDPIMSESEIAKLGQNVGISWPFKDSDETVAKYLEFEFEELNSVPGLVGKKGRVRTLMDILRETLAFDDPFGDLAQAVESDCVVDSTFDSILTKLEIPVDYPIDYIHFSKETKEMLHSEGMKTLIDCIHFGQKLGSDALSGGDLKNFLNGLAHKDEAGVAELIPFRPGMRGLHLAEAIGLIARDLSQAAKLSLMKTSGATLTAEEQMVLASEDEQAIEASLRTAKAQLNKVCGWFKDDAVVLEEIFNTGGAPERYFIMINKPERERLAVELAKMHFVVEEEKKPGLFGRIFGRK